MGGGPYCGVEIRLQSGIAQPALCEEFQRGDGRCGRGLAHEKALIGGAAALAAEGYAGPRGPGGVTGRVAVAEHQAGEGALALANGSAASAEELAGQARLASLAELALLVCLLVPAGLAWLDAIAARAGFVLARAAQQCLEGLAQRAAQGGRGNVGLAVALGVGAVQALGHGSVATDERRAGGKANGQGKAGHLAWAFPLHLQSV